MRVILIYSSNSRKFDMLAETIFSNLQRLGNQGKMVKVARGESPVSLFAYDLIFVGSPVLGFWGGKFSQELSSYLKQCTGFQGKKSAVFVFPKLLGTVKATKRLMQELENKGSIVIDFRQIKKKSEAQEFGTRLGKRVN